MSTSGFPDGSAVKNPPAKAGDASSIPGSGRSPGEENGNPLQCSCLGNPHGQRSLAGYGPQGHKESNTTEPLSTQAHGVGVCTRQHHGPIVTADPASPLHEVM